ncbi:MAG: hypothetical protein J1F13_02990 [Prevotellaceae bacterium]|nr:hypothetical protein [Prevotellaceae bacterium]
MSKDTVINAQINELVDRAMQPDDELLPLMMPETADSHKNTVELEEDDDTLESKSTRQVLIQALAEDEDERIEFSLPHVLRGDILTSKWLRQQIWWLVMLVAMAFFYVSNRYYAQKQMINISHLKDELKETHYDAMARSSQLMRNCRRSFIINQLTDSNSSLTMPEKQPAIVIE